MSTNVTYTTIDTDGFIPTDVTLSVQSRLNSFDEIARIVCAPLVDENTKLKSEKERLLEQHHNDQMKIDYLLEENVKMKEYKEKLEHAQEVIQTYKTALETHDPTPTFKYVYDLTDYDKDTPSLQIENNLDKLLLLANTRIKGDEYLIDCQMAVVPLFKLILNSGNKRIHYIGDLKTLVDTWNENVVSRIEDEKRKETLKCNYTTISKEMQNSRWKEISPESWFNLLYSGDTKSISKKILKRAVNIKDRYDRMFA